MAFKDLHKLKKIVEIQKENIDVDHLVVGKDLFAISTYKHLVNKYGEDKVRLLSEDIIGQSDLNFKGPSTLRGEENIKVFKALFPEIELDFVDSASIFYKDLTWKSFGGRSKSETLKYDEEFFVSPRMIADETKIFPWLANIEEEIKNLNEKAYQVKVKTILYKDEKFLVECINGTEFNCSQLYYGKSPYSFLKNYSDKAMLTDKFIQFCESTKTVSGLFIKYLFEKPFSDIKETMFIPLSYTHDWGHFVGEFKNFEGYQTSEFLHYMDEDHVSEEDVSRTIRNLKKGFEKIFENFLKTKITEFISIDEELGCLKIDDLLFEESFDQDNHFLKHVKFIGKSAPILSSFSTIDKCEYSLMGISHVARALIIDTLCVKKI